ncbi:MFS family permease [Halarchaeum rubridurum]|uniref:MFS family permease n=1 Tax=Halarchaeum rubridurum TaxID=489911 RepID=A0A830G3T6_9EURY|nr:MFS transporter [Halarchaeum rubridurum]MBP1955765.1 MFS family permease [Halarchaeum rubridurum]GGM74721.1 MFS transporter [Halarchaeum rubridurum]
MRRRLRTLDALAATAAIWFLAKFLRYAFPPLFPALSSRYGVTDATLGLAFTAMLLVYALLQFPAGAIADRVGATRVITAGAAVAGVAALALAVDAPFAVLVGAMVLVGIGTGVHKTVAIGLLSTVYTERTGRALGVLDTAGALAGVAAPAAVAFCLTSSRVTWHAVFLAGGLLGLSLAVLAYRWLGAREPERDDGDDERVPLRRYAALFRRPAFAGFVLVTVGFSFAYNGVVAFLPRYLETAGLTPATASAVYGSLFVVSLVQTVTGDLADRVGPLRVIVATLAVATVGLLALIAVGGGAGIVTLVGVVVVFGLGSHGFRPVRGAYLMALLPEDVSGGGLGVVRTVLMGAGAIAPGVVGVVSTYAGFRVAFGVLWVALAVAAVTAGVLLVAER